MADPDYFTLAEFRLLPGMSDTAKYADVRVNAVAASLTSIIEREVGTALVPRSVTQTITADGSSVLVLDAPHVQSVTSLTIDGVAISPGALYVKDGALRYSDGTNYFGSGVTRGNAVVVYQACHPRGVPADIKEALMWAVRDRLLATSATAGIDARRTSVVTEQGTTTYILPGADHPTGYPDLDAAIAGWDDLAGPGFA